VLHPPSLFTARDEADANASRRNVQLKLKGGTEFLAFTELPAIFKTQLLTFLLIKY
jgi:hypothetical protein